MRKKKSTIFIMMIFFAMLVGCNSDDEINRGEYLRERAIHAYAMRFEVQDSQGQRFYPLRWVDIATSVLSNPDETPDIIFVHTEIEALNYSSDVLVGWPSYATIGLVNYLNEYFYDQIEESLIEYPLTIEDVVDDWEYVLEFWRSLSNRDLIEIDIYQNDREGLLVEYEREAMNNNLRRWWRLGNRLEMFNDMIEGEDLSEFDLTWPINEADVEENVRAVEDVFHELLTREEREEFGD